MVDIKTLLLKIVQQNYYCLSISTDKPHFISKKLFVLFTIKYRSINLLSGSDFKTSPFNVDCSALRLTFEQLRFHLLSTQRDVRRGVCVFIKLHVVFQANYFIRTKTKNVVKVRALFCVFIVIHL